uniref:Uncharacterized protein n=1 Tax=Ascaris lumbricoides TaxID=6252 RepID=A0A0M3HFF2_ASCLU
MGYLMLFRSAPLYTSIRRRKRHSPKAAAKLSADVSHVKFCVLSLMSHEPFIRLYSSDSTTVSQRFEIISMIRENEEASLSAASTPLHSPDQLMTYFRLFQHN